MTIKRRQFNLENNRFEEKTKDIIKLAKQKGVIKSYETFCEENDSKSYSLLQEDIEYYSKIFKQYALKTTY